MRPAGQFDWACYWDLSGPRAKNLNGVKKKTWLQCPGEAVVVLNDVDHLNWCNCVKLWKEMLKWALKLMLVGLNRQAANSIRMCTSKQRQLNYCTTKKKRTCCWFLDFFRLLLWIWICIYCRYKAELRSFKKTVHFSASYLTSRFEWSR